MRQVCRLSLLALYILVFSFKTMARDQQSDEPTKNPGHLDPNYLSNVISHLQRTSTFVGDDKINRCFEGWKRIIGPGFQVCISPSKQTTYKYIFSNNKIQGIEISQNFTQKYCTDLDKQSKRLVTPDKVLSFYFCHKSQFKLAIAEMNSELAEQLSSRFIKSGRISRTIAVKKSEKKEDLTNKCDYKTDYSKYPDLTVLDDVRFSNSEIERYFSNLKTLLKSASGRPNMELGGIVNGYRIIAFEPDSVFNAVGMKLEDIVIEINGMNLDSPVKTMKIYSRFNKCPKSEILFIRDGKYHNLVVRRTPD